MVDYTISYTIIRGVECKSRRVRLKKLIRVGGKLIRVLNRLFNPAVTSDYKTSLSYTMHLEPSYASSKMIMRLGQIG